MKVLVTGGAGFIGSHLVDRLLAAGDDVRILDNLDLQVHDGPPGYLARDAELVVGDVRDPEQVGKALDGVGCVVHLAAAVGVGQSMYEIARYTSVNASGAAVVLEQVATRRDQLSKLVVASSMSIYGEGLYRCPAEGVEVTPRSRPVAQLERRQWDPVCPRCAAPLKPLPTPETKPLQPTSVYAIGKRDHEELFLAVGTAYDIPTTALRFFNVYGPRQSLANPYTGVVAIFATRLLNGRPPVVFEDGLQTRDFIHVADIVDGVVAALEPGRADGEAVNLGTGRATSILSVAETLAKQLGVDVDPIVRNVYRAGDIRHCFADTSRALDALGFTASTSFDAGMRELVDWLAGQDALDRVDDATAALEARGLTH